MVENTLHRMAEGGIYDHIGGGFHRYSVDEQWRVPHFEKMLYDQAQLVISYLELYQITKKSEHQKIVREVLEYVKRDMTSPEGAFYSAEDADSPRPENPNEHGEGAFYVWSQEEIHDILGAETASLVAAHYGVTAGGNALSDPQHEFTGRNIFYVAEPSEAVARRLKKSESEVRSILVEARTRLSAVRSLRPRPHLDDKVLTSWNGLMISAFARAYQVIRIGDYLRSAERAADFVLASLYDESSGRLLRRYRDGEAKFDAHLDDYAFLVQGLLDLYESSFEPKWLRKAITLTEKQNELFGDHKAGGFFETSGKDPSVLVRLKEQHDGAEPAGNSVAVLNILRLATIMENAELRQLAEEAFQSFASTLRQQPMVMPLMVAALEYATGKTQQIVLVGDVAGVAHYLAEIHSRFLPHKVVLLSDGKGKQSVMTPFSEFASRLPMIDNKPTAYLCEDYVCRLPTTDRRIFAGLLDAAMGDPDPGNSDR
jgi:hypothetical protein